MECLFKLLTTPPKEPPKPPPSFADMASRPATTVQQPAVDVSEAQAEEEAPLQLAWGAKPAGNNKWADSDDDEDGELDLSSLKAVVPPKPTQPEPKKEVLTTAPAAATATIKAVGEEDEEVAPPDDWRSLPVFPTHSDLSGSPLQLPRNVTNGEKQRTSTRQRQPLHSTPLSPQLTPSPPLPPLSLHTGRYESSDEYLMSSYLLLREDSLAPLRRGISSYRKREALDERTMHLYGNVELQSLRCAARGIVYRVTFTPMSDVDWQRTQRLVYGSLLALSCDHFDTILWAGRHSSHTTPLPPSLSPHHPPLTTLSRYYGQSSRGGTRPY